MKMIRLTSSLRVAGTAVFAASICLAAAGLLLSRPPSLHAQPQKIIWSNQEKPIADQIRGLRGLPDDVRARTTKNLALEIRQLPVTPNKLRLANDLANLSTEGDFGRDTLQEVATTLAAALHEQPVQAKQGQPPSPYLRGKVVLVNFWATWCPPCRKEMPDLETLYKQFKDQGLVILAISDEDESKVTPFVAEQRVTYPILLDPGRKVNELFQIEGIPKTFVYDRSGKLVAQSIDMRTRRQFLEMLAQAGLQ